MISRESRPSAYLGSVAAVTAANLLTFAIRPWMGGSISMLFFPAVILPGAYAGYGPALLAAVLATGSMAYFFIPPVHVLNLGIDDAIRFSVFSTVSTTAAWLSARRRHAENALKESMRALERNLETLRQVSDWPAVIGHDAPAKLRSVLAHAALIVHARAAAVAWEAEDEPWLYVASTEGQTRIAKEPVSKAGGWRSDPPHLEIVRLIGDDAAVSTIFETEHVAGRLYFTGVDRQDADFPPRLALVAHEIGHSLGQLQLAERMRQLAVHQDRIRVARDLHDGVLQALTGVRLQLRSIAEKGGRSAQRLCALEQALAVEQRELRLFIDDLRPSSRAVAESGAIATRLQNMCGRLSSEWRIPVTVRVMPPDVRLPADVEQEVRLMIHEGVSNALKHAHPSRISVDIEAGSDLTIRITDDGLGFGFRGRLEHDALERLPDTPVSLRERVLARGGRMSVDSQSTGSVVEFVLPIAPLEDGHLEQTLLLSTQRQL